MIRGALFDLSGVLYVGNQPLPGATSALEKLRAESIPTRFITNVSRTPSRMILERLNRMGFRISSQDLFTAPIAARNYLVTHARRPYLIIHPDLEEEFADFAGGTPNAVLVGDAGEEFTYKKLNQAFRLLITGAPLLAIGNNRYFREADGLSLDIGPFVTALEYASGMRAIILGKPAREFFQGAVASLGCAPEEVVMVGDDALADVDGALAAGLQGILVQTGKYRARDEAQITRPGAIVVVDVVGAVDWILANT